MKYVDEQLAALRQAQEDEKYATIHDNQFIVLGRVYYLERREVIPGAWMLFPKDFILLKQDLAQLKYPSTDRPSTIYTDSDLCTNFSFSVLDMNLPAQDMGYFTHRTKEILRRLNPANVFYTETVLCEDKVQIGFLDYKSCALDGDIYNILFEVIFDEKILMGTFNCDYEHRKPWEAVVRQLLPSISFEQQTPAE